MSAHQARRQRRDRSKPKVILPQQSASPTQIAGVNQSDAGEVAAHEEYSDIAEMGSDGTSTPEAENSLPGGYPVAGEGALALDQLTEEDEPQLPSSIPPFARSGVRDAMTMMLEEMRELFKHDRVVGARADAVRCGICYLIFPANEMVYDENDGCYQCSSCRRELDGQHLPMLRRQRP